MNNYVKTSLSYSTQRLCGAESDLLLPTGKKPGFAATSPAEAREGEGQPAPGSAWAAL